MIDGIDDGMNNGMDDGMDDGMKPLGGRGDALGTNGKATKLLAPASIPRKNRGPTSLLLSCKPC